MWAVRDPLATPRGRRDPPTNSYSAGCSDGGGSIGILETFLGAIQNRSGRSNRKRGKVWRTAQNKASAPITPNRVTTRETAPMSAIQPVLMSQVRESAIGRKKAR